VEDRESVNCGVKDKNEEKREKKSSAAATLTYLDGLRDLHKIGIRSE
jgi:hypothetical protein